MSKILLITDSTKIIFDKVFHNNQSENHYHLHAINISSESILHTIQNHQQYKNINVSETDNYEINQLAENEAREYYIKLIRDLPDKKILSKKSFSELLTKNNRNYWWYLPISEKNIWIDKTIHRLYEIKRLKYILNKNDYVKIYSCLGDSLLQDSFSEMLSQKKIPFIKNIKKNKNKQRRFVLLLFCISYFINALKAIVGLLIKKIILLNYRATEESVLGIKSVGIFSFFPLFWKDLESDQPRNIFLNRLPNEIAKKYKVKHFIWLSPWKELVVNRNWLRQMEITNETYFLEKQLSIKDTLSLLKFNIFFVLLSILVGKNKVNIGSLDGVKINDIIYDELYYSFSSSTFFEALLIDKALQKVPLENLNLMIFRLEFQPHERAILYNTNGKVHSLGYQHSALSKNFLNYVFMKDELGSHWGKKDESSSMTLPDQIFTSGSVGFDYMKDAGYPKDHLFVCGALRYNDLRKNCHLILSKSELRIQYNIPNQKKIIFVATTPIIHETVAMMRSLYLAIKTQKQDSDEIYVVIKRHPNTLSMKDYQRKFNKIIEPWDKIVTHEIVLNSINVHEYIKLSDVILTSGGTIPLEAMILGVPSIIFSPNFNFSHNPLYNYPQSAFFVNDTKSMSSAINKVVKNELKAELKNNWVHPVNDMLGIFKNNQTEEIIKLIDSF